jgi:hypothetical protein
MASGLHQLMAADHIISSVPARPEAQIASGFVVSAGATIP